MAQFFKITPDGVHAGEGSNTRNTPANPTYESNIPTHFYIDTTLPEVVSYSPEWVSASEGLYNVVSVVEPIAVKKIGAHVFIDGCVSITLSSTNFPINFMPLPEPLRPQFDHYCFIYTESTGYYSMHGSLKFSTSGMLTLETLSEYNSYGSSGNAFHTGTYKVGFSTDYWCADSTPFYGTYVSLPYDAGASNGIQWAHTSSTTPFFGYTGTTSNIGFSDNGTMELHATGSSTVNGCWYTSTPILLDPNYTLLNASLTTAYSKSADKSVTIGLIAEDFSATLVKNGSNSSFTNLGANCVQATPVNFANTMAQDISCTVPLNLDFSKRYYIFILITSTRYVSGYSNNSTGCTKVWFT